MDVSEYAGSEWDAPLPTAALPREGERLERRTGYFRYPEIGLVKRLDRVYRVKIHGRGGVQPPQDTPEPVRRLDAGGGELVFANAMAADYALVKLRDEGKLEALPASLSGYALHEDLGDGLVLLKVPTDAPNSLEAALRDLCGKQADVEYAQPAFAIYPLTPSVTPDDPYFAVGSQWNINRINAPTATGGWGVRMGYNSVAEGACNVVAIMDSGMDLTHQDLAGNLWTNPGWNVPGYAGLVHGWDFLTVPNPGNVPQDDMGHGTQVAGVIGAIGNNGIGITGVAQQLQLMPLRIMGLNQLADGPTVTKALKFIDLLHAASYPNKIVKVVNHSWGMVGFDRALFDQINNSQTLPNTKPALNSVRGTWPANSNTVTLTGTATEIAKITSGMVVTGAGLPANCTVLLTNVTAAPYSMKISNRQATAQTTAIYINFSDAVIQKPVGLVHVAAAAGFGNNSDDIPNYPSCFPSRLIISVGGSTTADTPNLSCSDYGPRTVDLFAPGETIWTTTLSNQFTSVSGSSVAAAHVSGAAALFRMQFPAVSEVNSLLTLCARVQLKPGLSGQCVTGGLLDLNAALRSTTFP